MIVFRDALRETRMRDALAGWGQDLQAILQAGAATHDAATNLLISYGEVESALADLLCPGEDGPDPVVELARRAALQLAHLHRSAWRGHRAGVEGAARAALSAVEALGQCDLPACLTTKVPEGFAFYALYPEAYVVASERFAAARERGRAVVIGLRSIGTTLSAVVGAALEAEGWEIETLTLRPRGHPFLRRPVLSPELEGRLRGSAGVMFLIVDEGPGLSGSSMTGAAELLSSLGVPDNRIVFFPAWRPTPDAFVSAAARGRWPRHELASVTLEDAFGADLFPATDDISAGCWRKLFDLDEARWPAVHPQHERRKYLHSQGGEGQRLTKFAGLGRHGAERLALAERLAGAGFAPEPLGLETGFLTTRWARARPLRRRDLDAAFLDHAARYLAFRASGPRLDAPAGLETLLHMTEHNIGLGLGEEWRSRLGRLEVVRRALEDAPAVALDGRCQPHEWLKTSEGYLKADAVDHWDDHFFPGPADPAWDVAGFVAEFGLDPAGRQDFASRVAALARDPGLAARLPFYTVAYLAFRLGYAWMAERSLREHPDGHRFARLVRRYRWQLKRALLSFEASVGR